MPGTTGGSVHVVQVASGLAALGHDVHALASPGGGPFQDDGVHWHGVGPPLRLRHLRWTRAGYVTDLARSLGADVVMERYFNFGGEGIRAAARTGALAVLEVNAPVIDHPGSLKRWIDRALVIEPMRRWRDWQCRRTNLFVTPSAEILPPWVSPERVLRIEWGADTARFTPESAGEVPFQRQPGDIVVVFAGAFRPWHGAIDLVRAIEQIRSRDRHDIKAVFVGDGPELGRVRAAARGVDGIEFVGAIPHGRMPACLAAADIGVAPFDVTAHGPLQIAFYWSPLKVFEYMAAGLPVVAPAIPRLQELVRDEREGWCYSPGSPTGLADAIVRAADSRARPEVGRAARRRVVEEFGWDGHCRRLSEALERALRTRDGAATSQS
ncbi:MAG TPA: glycosyltransferase family 4 protein [Vicinamibacterales bacterium]|nr:glycosyltransferase family 4 protein [Vicinamibacterales bacterium]